MPAWCTKCRDWGDLEKHEDHFCPATRGDHDWSDEITSMTSSNVECEELCIACGRKRPRIEWD